MNPLERPEITVYITVQKKIEELGDYISSDCVSEEHECLGQK